MQIEQFNRESKGHFAASDEGKKAGIMTYSWAGQDKIIIDHTEVEEEFRGKNVGKELVYAAVKYARENKIKVMPLCPFAKKVFDREKEIQDVLF